MPTITLTMSASHATRIENALATLYGYQANIIDGEGQTIPNSETKTQFAKRMVQEWIRERVKTAERTNNINSFESSFQDISIT
jgi:hypothetical protein